MKLRTQGKIAIAIITIALTAGVIFLLNKFAPEAEEDKREEALPTVHVITVESSSTAIEIPSQGLIEAPTETSLAAEVGGAVVYVSEKFEVGEDFKKDDVIIEIEDADYAAVLAQMEANVADAELNLALEEGQARRVKRDVDGGILGDDTPSDLALRKPQVKSAKAKLVSATAAVAKAKRDLERTKIRAPYDGRIRAAYTDIGSFVAPGTRIADIYANSGFEIRLPITLDDYAFIEDSGSGNQVRFKSNIGGEEKAWKGTIVRDEGVIDRTSRSVYLVANIDGDEKSKFLSPGLFLKATITGRTLDNVISLPRKALYGKDRIYVIDDKNLLHFRTVTVVRTERDRVLITDGLEAGEHVCITNLAAAIDKMKVDVLPDKEEGKAVDTAAPSEKPDQDS